MRVIENFLSIGKANQKIDTRAVELSLIYAYKRLYHALLTRASNQRILIILGCQRSGTSQMTRVFFRDIQAKVYRESSILSSRDPEKLRLNSYQELEYIFRRDRARLVVLKPLVESQNSRAFLQYFPNAQALWMYRHYKDVAASNLAAFGIKNGVSDLRGFIQKDNNNWRSEHASVETNKIITKYFAEDMNPYDAAALFWFARNQLFYDLALNTERRVLLFQYENWVAEPDTLMQRVYEFLDLPYPGKKIVTEVHNQSIKKGKNVDLSPEVNQLCLDLLTKLNPTYQQQLATITHGTASSSL